MSLYKRKWNNLKRFLLSTEQYKTVQQFTEREFAKLADADRITTIENSPIYTNRWSFIGKSVKVRKTRKKSLLIRSILFETC